MPHRKKVVGSDAFSTLDVCKICKIPRERLRDWLFREYITPSSYITEKSREIAVFDTERVLIVMLFKMLVEEGYHRDYAGILLYNTADDYEVDIMTVDQIQLESQTDSIIWTVIDIENPRNAVLKSIELLKGGE